MKNANCEFCGSDKSVRNHDGKKLLCGKHRQHMERFGELRKRTTRDPNDYIDCGDYYEMIIYDKNCKEKARALIDKEDKEKALKVGSWCLDSGGYPMNGRVKTALHRYLMGKKEGLEIDHINGNKLDNRKCNLRFVKHRENTKSWVKVYKEQILKEIKNHLADRGDIEGYFKELD